MYEETIQLDREQLNEIDQRAKQFKLAETLSVKLANLRTELAQKKKSLADQKVKEIKESRENILKAKAEIFAKLDAEYAPKILELRDQLVKEKEGLYPTKVVRKEQPGGNALVVKKRGKKAKKKIGEQESERSTLTSEVSALTTL